MDNLSLLRRIAVTGATGMIGSHLVAEMVRAGYTGIILPVRSRGRIDNMRRTFRRVGVEWPDEGVVTIVETELTDPATLTEVFRGVDSVFNCAATIMTGDMTGQQLIDNNVAVARSVAEASVAAGVQRIIHISSIIVLEPGGNGVPITEGNRAHGDHGSAYARSKFLADCEMRRAADVGISLTLLYPAVVLGEGDWSANGSSAMIPMIASGQPFYTNGVMAYVDARDVARACIAVEQSPDTHGENFIVAGENLTLHKLINLGAEAAGRRKPFIRVGTPLALFIYGLIRLATALHLMKDRSITRSNIDSVLKGNRYSGEKLTKMCGFRYTPLQETVDRVVNAYLKERP